MTDAVQEFGRGELVPGRQCGSCSMCCKVFAVPVLEKPPGQWCKHCKPGRGCSIWTDRPQFCRDYHCFYMYEARFPDIWRPDRSKFIMNFRATEKRYVVNVDPATPNAWRQEPYFSTLKAMSGDFLKDGMYLQVVIGRTNIFLTPEHETTLVVDGDENTPLDLQLMVTQNPDGTRKRWFKAAVKAAE
jgi:hypothetical protein